MHITPRKSTDRGGYLMMPLIKNIPEPCDPEWKQTTCPSCGRECWERPLPAGIDRLSFGGVLCTECALISKYNNNAKPPDETDGLKYDKELYLDNEIYGLDEDFVKRSEKVVKCRKPHECNNCGNEIESGNYAICETGFMYGNPVSTYTCIKCMEGWMEELGRVETGDEE